MDLCIIMCYSKIVVHEHCNCMGRYARRKELAEHMHIYERRQATCNQKICALSKHRSGTSASVSSNDKKYFSWRYTLPIMGARFGADISQRWSAGFEGGLAENELTKPTIESLGQFGWFLYRFVRHVAAAILLQTWSSTVHELGCSELSGTIKLNTICRDWTRAQVTTSVGERGVGIPSSLYLSRWPSATSGGE